VPESYKMARLGAKVRSRIEWERRGEKRGGLRLSGDRGVQGQNHRENEKQRTLREQ